MIGQNFIGTRILKYIGGKLDGKKTWIGGISLILSALIGLVNIMFPELAISVPNGFEDVLNRFGEGMLGVGIGHKIMKAK